MGTTAEIKPFEPETGNAGVGKMKMQNTFYTHFFGAIRTDMPKREHTQSSRKDFSVCQRKILSQQQLSTNSAQNLLMV
jgi:hypothetical protein